MTDNPSWLLTFRESQQTLWVLAVLSYGIGDTVTTAIGLEMSETAEAGPVAATFVDTAGIGGLLTLKLIFFGVSVLGWYVIQSPSRVAIPLAIAFAGVLVTAWNGVMLLL